MARTKKVRCFAWKLTRYVPPKKRVKILDVSLAEIERREKMELPIQIYDTVVKNSHKARVLELYETRSPLFSSPFFDLAVTVAL